MTGRRRLQFAVRLLVAALAIFVGANVTTPNTVDAWAWSSRVIVQIHACPGGSIMRGQFYGNESGWTNVYGANDMAADLKNVPFSGTTIKFGVQCSNGVWYYSNWRTVKRPGYSVYTDLGWM